MNKRCLCLVFFLTVLLAYLGIVSAYYKVERGNSFFLFGIVLICEIFVVLWSKLNYWVKRVLLCFYIIGFIIGITTIYSIETGKKSDTIPTDLSIDYILILGNGIDGNDITESLRKRLDKGFVLAGEYKCPIIVSGGTKAKNDKSEADVMEQYLVEKYGYTQIIKERFANNTKQNFENSFAITGNTNIIFVTSDYHLFRSRLLGKLGGYRNIYGIGTKSSDWLNFYYYLREICAIWRELLLGK